VVVLDNLSIGRLGNLDSVGRHPDLRFVEGSVLDELLVPYAQAYASGFEDVRRRVPNTTKVRELTGWQPTPGPTPWRTRRESSPTGPDRT